MASNRLSVSSFPYFYLQIIPFCYFIRSKGSASYFEEGGSRLLLTFIFQIQDES